MCIYIYIYTHTHTHTIVARFSHLCNINSACLISFYRQDDVLIYSNRLPFFYLFLILASTCLQFIFINYSINLHIIIIIMYMVVCNLYL